MTKVITSPYNVSFNIKLKPKIAKCFCNLNPKLNDHTCFLKQISQRTDEIVPIFSLNYDPLFERAADSIRVQVVDGFTGIECAFYNPSLFQGNWLKTPKNTDNHPVERVRWVDCRKFISKLKYQNNLKINSSI